MHQLLPMEIQALQAVAEECAREPIASQAEAVDRDCRWPEHSMRTLADANLMGLHVPERIGGHGQGLLALTVVAEALAKACPSSSLCFGMHCVATAVIAAKATKHQEEGYLYPIAEGRHITTLALSEPGTGVHFYLPQTTLKRDGEAFLIDGTKHFVTNGGHADSYVISTQASGDSADRGEFSCLLVDRDQAGMSWLDPWRGFGMRGNSSRGLRLDHVRVPAGNLLGQEGDQIWYIFEIVAPYFLMAMAGTYLGVAQAAFDTALHYVRGRHYEHSGETLAQISSLQHKLAELWIKVHEARGLIYYAAQLGDRGDPKALVAILSSKAAAGDIAVEVTNEAMTVCGGIAFRENGTLSRLLRDARASHVMSPTTDVLKLWLGRSLLGLPII